MSLAWQSRVYSETRRHDHRSLPSACEATPTADGDRQRPGGVVEPMRHGGAPGRESGARYGITQMIPMFCTLAQDRPVLHVPVATVPEPQQG